MALDSFDFGQSERLTSRLASLVRKYPPGLGVFKEFIQNADDAGASCVRFVMDWRTHRAATIPDRRMTHLLGPSLLVYNDARFTPDDLAAIRRIGEGSKFASGPKTGRFGLGFNTTYNLTDYPSFVTNDGAYCFDPHQNAVADTTGYGRGWRLASLWREASDWPASFEAAGLKPLTVDFAGTIFRLPIRTVDRARFSEISKEPFTTETFELFVRQAADAAEALLLFAKSVLGFSIEEISDAGTTTRLLVSTTNAAEVVAARDPARRAAEGDLATILGGWAATDATLPYATYRHGFRVAVGAKSEDRTWRIVAGLFAGPERRLVHFAREMVTAGEKAIPWVGVAARVGAKGPVATAGRLCCGLPLPVAADLPVHVNGYFDLDDSRQSLTAAADSTGGTVATRVRWNDALLMIGAPWAWTQLIKDMAPKDPADFYAIWPKAGAPGSVEARLAGAVYDQLRDEPVVWSLTSGGRQVGPPTAVRMPEASWRPTLREPLVADGLPWPDPALPQHVEAGFSRSMKPLAPADLRNRLRGHVSSPSTPKPGWSLASPLRPSMGRLEWISNLLGYCLSDAADDLAGVPLCLLADDQMVRFGDYRVFLGTKAQRELLRDLQPWFLAPELQAKLDLKPTPKNLVVVMALEHLVDGLTRTLGTDASRPWVASAPGLPNGPWLVRVFEHLAEHAAKDEVLKRLRELPLLPDGAGQLHSAASEDAPLLVSAEEGRRPFLAALEAGGVPVVKASAATVDALRRLRERHPSLVPILDAATLVRRLHARRAGLAIEARHAGAILDFLAEARWSWSASDIELLREVALLPAMDGCVAADAGNVYCPAGFTPPAVSTPFHLVSDGGRWAALFKRLGVHPLDPVRYLQDVLAPALHELPGEDCEVALTWLRDNATVLLPQLGRKERDTRIMIARAPIVEGEDGERHAMAELHDPESELVRTVLGEGVVFPNRQRYRTRWGQWQTFFRAFGMASSPTVAHLLGHIDRLVAFGSVDRTAMQRVWKHIEARWHELKDEAVEGGRHAESFADALARRTWLPAKVTSTAPGFVAPEDRAYKPSELQRAEDLVGSQAPVAAWEVRDEVARDLDMEVHAPPAIVLAHFRVLLDLWDGANDAPFDPKPVGKALNSIYRYLGRASDDDRRDDHPTFSHSDRSVLNVIAEGPCIWDDARRRFWLPQHVFASPVPFFEPLRTMLGGATTGAAFDLLGRRREPEVDDFIAFLSELQERADGGPLDGTARNQAIYALQQLADSDVPEDLPILARDGCLLGRWDLYVDDAPWLRARTTGLAVAASEVPRQILRRLEVRKLSECVRETLASALQTGVSSEAHEACDELGRRLAASQFRAGLLRLVRHHHDDPERLPDLGWLRRLKLRVAAELQAELVLDGHGAIGRAPVKSFYNERSETLYLAAGPLPRMVKWVAELTHRLLDAEDRFDNLTSVEHMLQCDSGQVAEVLDDDRITHTDVSDIVVMWQQGSPETTGGANEEPGADAPDGDGVDDGGTDGPNLVGQASSAPPRGGDGVAFGATAGFIDASGGVPPRSTAWLGAAGGDAAFAGSELPRSAPGGVPGAPLGPRLASDSLWRSSSPPTGAGDGRSRVRRDGMRGDLVLAQPGDGPDDVSAEVEEQAIALVLSFEFEQGRDAIRMPKDHPGYDIESRGPGELMRYIEVKGTTRDWRDRAVQVSQTQLTFAFERRSESWLYVVERLAGKPKLHRIQDPAQYIKRFAFGSTWASHAEAAPPLTIPAVGHVLLEGDAPFGIIEEVKRGGSLIRLKVKRPDGKLVEMTFKPGNHTLRSPDDGDDSS